MELPSPDVDELGRPWWSGTSADVSKAYRRLSILVHPARFPCRCFNTEEDTKSSSYLSGACPLFMAF